MDELHELYQEVILDHSKHPRNYRKMEGAGHSSEGYNPLCGDQITVYVRIENDIITDISFEGSGCAISKASASIMTSALKGKTRAEAEELFERFHHMVTASMEEDIDTAELGKLAVFDGVREFPVRVKCASLAWHTMHAAIEDEDKTVTTE